MSNSNQSFKTLLPVSKPQYLAPEGEITIPRYRVGNPRNYRLNLGDGTLKLGDIETLTRPGQPFNILPFALRILTGKLFGGKEEKKWCEMYFINARNQLCMFMFHGFSVENLLQKSETLFYDGCEICDAKITVSLLPKTDNKGHKFFIADFHFTPLADIDQTLWREIIDQTKKKHFHIFRSDTSDFKTLVQQNWSDGKTQTVEEIEAEEIRTAALVSKFSEKPKPSSAGTTA